MTISTWDDKKISRLRELANIGASASIIASELHCSRNAVIGKMNRLKMHREKPTVTNAHMPAVRSSSERKSKPRSSRRISNVEPVPLLNLRWYHCRAVLDQPGPDGLALYCGRHTIGGGSPWCAKHYRAYHVRRSP